MKSYVDQWAENLYFRQSYPFLLFTVNLQENTASNKWQIVISIIQLGKYLAYTL